jgi:hypothetical protein
VLVDAYMRLWQARLPAYPADWAAALTCPSLQLPSLLCTLRFLLLSASWSPGASSLSASRATCTARHSTAQHGSQQGQHSHPLHYGFLGASSQDRAAAGSVQPFLQTPADPGDTHATPCCDQHPPKTPVQAPLLTPGSHRCVVPAAPHDVLPDVFELLDPDWLYEEVAGAMSDAPHDCAVLVVGRHHCTAAQQHSSTAAQQRLVWMSDKRWWHQWEVRLAGWVEACWAA